MTKLLISTILLVSIIFTLTACTPDESKPNKPAYTPIVVENGSF